MSAVSLSLKGLFESYKSWVCDNPETAGEVESIVKWVSYLVAGRANSSYILTELVYSASNLFVLFNDLLIHSSRKTLLCSGAKEKLKIFLTVIEYSEVFIEITAKKLWGDKGKWFLAVIVQVFKCIARLTLLLHHKENILSCPPIEVLKRSNLPNLLQGETEINSNDKSTFNNIAFTLKGSGKVIRRVNGAPNINTRLWVPPNVPNSSDRDLSEYQLKGNHLTAEILYIIKPVAHLGTMLKFGSDAWKPWLFSLAIDLTSLFLYSKRKPHQQLSKRQRLELSRRYFSLLMYLMRSPCYDKYSRRKVDALLDSLAANIPLARLICNPVKQLIPQWQEKYFYLWSS